MLGARIRHRPWDTVVKGEIQSTLTAMATNTKNNLTVAAWGAAVPAIVTANIWDAAGLLVATGTYNSGTGIHAEVAAIQALGSPAWTAPHTIRTTLEPCHRCAVVLRAFVVTYGWTVQAPQQAFASNYPGAYLLPDNIYAVITAQLAPTPILERAHYEAKIKSLICGFGVA